MKKAGWLLVLFASLSLVAGCQSNPTPSVSPVSPVTTSDSPSTADETTPTDSPEPSDSPSSDEPLSWTLPDADLETPDHYTLSITNIQISEDQPNTVDVADATPGHVKIITGSFRGSWTFTNTTPQRNTPLPYLLLHGLLPSTKGLQCEVRVKGSDRCWLEFARIPMGGMGGTWGAQLSPDESKVQGGTTPLLNLAGDDEVPEAQADKILAESREQARQMIWFINSINPADSNHTPRTLNGTDVKVIYNNDSPQTFRIVTTTGGLS